MNEASEMKWVYVVLVVGFLYWTKKEKVTGPEYRDLDAYPTTMEGMMMNEGLSRGMIPGVAPFRTPIDPRTAYRLGNSVTGERM